MEHAHDLIKERLAPAHLKKDGKQTPFHGHPVFIAQHATATCCRSCLLKWHGFAKGVNLNSREIDRVVGVTMSWIKENIDN